MDASESIPLCVYYLVPDQYYRKWMDINTIRIYEEYSTRFSYSLCFQIKGRFSFLDII